MSLKQLSYIHLRNFHNLYKLLTNLNVDIIVWSVHYCIKILESLMSLSITELLQKFCALTPLLHLLDLTRYRDIYILFLLKYFKNKHFYLSSKLGSFHFSPFSCTGTEMFLWYELFHYLGILPSLILCQAN